ncbi:hypothetical protein PR048_028636 [Dryococelus australis]|uniref:Uncharacterized protein n=1 Tax=Dryococelus australis TaxID=614101 RepID=A0ABQ9GBK1_9NEOP|nr:hypothetical protein PR048_028636 [Dryococelus australis]
MGDTRENPPTSGTARHDFPVQKSESEPAESRSRFALVGGERSNRHTTAQEKSGFLPTLQPTGYNNTETDKRTADLPCRSRCRLVRLQPGVREALGSNPGQGMGVNLS